jgi:hypothetical protein
MVSLYQEAEDSSNIIARGWAVQTRNQQLGIYCGFPPARIA